jgi:hypothetical protein
LSRIAIENDRNLLQIANLWIDHNPKIWDLVGCDICHTMRRSFSFDTKRLDFAFYNPCGQPSIYWSDDQLFLSNFLHKSV